ncbi:Uncharacterised protein [Pseudomonas aeruginosa]|nr:Uncharacterised protein [Pseudomonas aeruginosa]
MCYLGFVAGVVIMGLFVRWVLFRTPSRPSVPGSLTFTTAIAVPLMLAGDRRPGALADPPAAGRAAACAYSGTPAVHRPAAVHCACRSGRHCSTPSASSAFGFLTLLTTAFIFIEFWGQSLAGSGEYLR